MKKNHNKKRGFTMVEIIVSIGIITMVVFTATELVVAIIRSNAENVDTLIAYGLAQEGLEGVRNIRDSDWLLNAKFNGEIRVGQVSYYPWVGMLPVNGETKYYTIDLNDLDSVSSLSGPTSVGALSDAAPWKLIDITSTNASPDIDYGKSAETLLNKFENTSPVETRYTHNAGSATPFHRYIMINNEDGSTLRVASIVDWEQFGRNREVRLDTEITDWKGGPL